MPKPSKRAVTMAIFMTVVLIAGLLVGLMIRPSRPWSFFRPAPLGLTMKVLGNATNYLKFDQEHDWKALCISNGTSKTVFYTVTEVEYRTADGWHSAGSWLSNTLTNTSLMTRRETTGEIAPGSNDVFYATIATTNLPWRLRVGCFEQSWQDSSLVRSIRSPIGGRTPPTSKSWSGRRYELVGGEINQWHQGAAANSHPPRHAQ
jgi:hypothetical protein